MMPEATRPLRVFLCHSSNDKLIVRDLYRRLDAEGWIDAWLDSEKLFPGHDWNFEIEKAVEEADAILVCLTKNSVSKEGYVQRELRMVLDFVDYKPEGTLFVIPVRLEECEPPRRLRTWQYADYFPESDRDLAYQRLLVSLTIRAKRLDLLIENPVEEKKRHETDTTRSTLELKQSILEDKLPNDETLHMDDVSPAEKGFPTVIVKPLNDLGSPGGTTPYQSPFYIERDSDRDAIQVLQEMNGITLTIKGPSQTGKSSLLNRIMTEAKKRGMKVAFVDFQAIDNSAIERSDIFYRQFCNLLSLELGVEDRTEEFWKNPLGQVQKTTNYVNKHLLKELQDTQLLLGMDEVERMFISPFRSDFFSMLRSWHNSRARGGDWTRFNIALVTSTEPYQLIADLNQSPFNVGTVVELKDFTPFQVVDLNQRHGSPLSSEQVAKISELLGGHPYLTHMALYLTASKRATFDDIVKTACEDDGPFGDHLRNHLFRMSDDQELKSGLTQVINYQRCTDEHVFFRLRGAGLVRRVGNDVLPRNVLYAEYFGKRLND